MENINDEVIEENIIEVDEKPNVISKVKSFAKRNRKKIAVGAVLAGVGLAGMIIRNRSGKSNGDDFDYIIDEECPEESSEE